MTLSGVKVNIVLKNTFKNNPADLVLKNYPLFQSRDETLAFLRQFGSSGQAVISGVNKISTPLSASAIET